MRKTNKLLGLVLAAAMTVSAVPSMALAADGDSQPPSITGEKTEDGKAWQFVIPEDASGEVELDFSEYLDALVRKPGEKDQNWDPGRKATLPFTIKNESGKVYKYSDADFSLDMKAESDEDIYYISGKTPYEERPEEIGFHSAVRTLNQPLQSLYKKVGSSDLTVEEVVKAEEKINMHGEVTVGDKTEKIPDTVVTYSDYVLWYYNTFFNADAKSLSELPQVYKLNALGYAVVNNDEDLNQGNSTAQTDMMVKDMTAEQIDEQLVQPMNKLIEGRGLGYNLRVSSNGLWATYTCVIMETDPEMIKLAQDVFYKYGLRFTFDSEADKDKVFFVDRAQSMEEMKAQMAEWMKDEGELGWTTLCNTDFSVDTLKNDTLTYAQQSVKNTIGDLKLQAGESADYDHVYLTAPAYAVVNAHRFMGALKGLGLKVSLKAVEDAHYDTEALDITKTTKGAELKDGQFEFMIGSDAEAGIHFEKTTAKNDKAGNIDFGEITFDKAGEYVVTVKEVIPEKAEEGWEYDDSVKEFLFVVTEEDFGYRIEAGAKEEKAEFVNKFTPKKVVPEKEDQPKQDPPKQDPPKEEPVVPKTGDTSNMMLYTGMLLLAAAVVTGSIFRRRENR